MAMHECVRNAIKHLHTDVFWLLSLLGRSFTPLDFISICFFTRKILTKKTMSASAATNVWVKVHYHFNITFGMVT